jgi:hypothetical protein
MQKCNYILYFSEYTYIIKLIVETLGCHRNQIPWLGLDFVMESSPESNIDSSLQDKLMHREQ